MAYDEAKAIAALHTADTSGDIEGAQHIADYIKSNRAQAPKEKPAEPSTTEKIFGKGTTQDTPFSERLSRVGKAGTAGAVIGGGLGATAGALAGGVGAIPGGITGAAIGGVGGMLGEVGEQASAALGGGRTTQVLTGLASGAIGGEASNVGVKTLGALFHPIKTAKKLMDVFAPSAESEGVQALRNKGVETAKQALSGEGGLKATTDVGETISAKVKNRVARAQAIKTKAEKVQTTEHADILNQHATAEKEVAKTMEEGVGGHKSEFETGSNIRQDVVETSDPIYKARAEEYKKASSEAMASAKASEDKGNFWAATKDARDIRKHWKEVAARSSKPVAVEINATLDDIWRNTAIKNEWGETIGQKQTQLGLEGIDQIIRRLGEASSKETEGYKAIGSATAKALRRDLTHGLEKNTGERSGGIYDWSELGPAKTAYKEASENLNKYESTRGASVLEKQTGMDLSKVDAEKLPKIMLGTESGFNEFKTMVQPEKLAQHVDQYTRNALKGKDVKEIRAWASEHPHLKDIPEVQNLVNNQLNKLSALESKASMLKDISTKINEKPWTSKIDAKAKEWVDTLGLGKKGAAEVDANKIVSGMLTSKQTGSQLVATAKYLNDVPEIRAKFPEAVAYHLSQQSPATMLKTFDELRPALAGSGLVDEAGLVTMRSQILDVVKASKATPSLDVQSPLTNIFKNIMKRGIPVQAFRAITQKYVDKDKQ